MHDVAVLDDVLLAFDAELAGLADAGLATERNVVVVFDDLGADEAFLEVGVDDAGALRGLAAAHERPGTHLVGSGGEVGLQVEQVVGGAYQSRDAALVKSYLGQELLSLLPCVQLGDFALGLGGDDEHVGILALYGLADGLGVLVAGGGGGVIDVADVEYGLVGEQEELAGKLALVDGVELHRACGLTLVEGVFVGLEDRCLQLGRFVASGLGGLDGAGEAALDGLEVFELQLVVDNLLVADGVDAAVDVGDVVVVEAAQDVQDGVGLAYVGKELVAQALALAGAFDQAGDVDNLYRGGHYRTRLAHLDQLGEALVGNGDDAHVGLDGAEGEVCRLRLGV